MHTLAFYYIYCKNIKVVKIILILFLALWLLGFIQVPLLNTTLFSIANNPFSLQSILILALIIWAISLLPGIFRTILIILLILWLLTNIGFFAGLSNILIILLILVIIFSLL